MNTQAAEHTSTVHLEEAHLLITKAPRSARHPTGAGKWLLLACLTAAAVAVHGYHGGAEDAEIYLPGVLKHLNPSLFARNSEFFDSQGGMTMFPSLISDSARLLHLPAFALDPDYERLPGEDVQGFRVIAQRSMLADNGKDSGAVSMFPSLAAEWSEQVNARRGWKEFQRADFLTLKTRYGVDWVVLQQAGSRGLTCPYQNDRVPVCRID